MLPVLAQFTVGGADVTVRAYSTCLLLAAVAAGWLFVRSAERLGAPRRRAVLLVLGALAAGIAGARALDVALNPAVYARDPGLAFSTDARGFALYGGIAGAAAVALAGAPWAGVGRARLADGSVPAFAAGLAIVRVGCFLNGCCGGVPTSVPWAVRFPAGGSSWSSQLLGGSTGALFGHVETVHPTQLYELGAVLLCAALASGAASRWRLAPGGRALLFAALFLAFRVANQQFRAPTPGGALGATALTAAYLAGALAAGLVLTARSRSRASLREAA